MSDLSLDYKVDSPGYGDLRIERGDLVLTSDVNPAGTNSVIQNVTQRLRFMLGEWFLDTSAGVPWLQQILVKQADPSNVDGLLRDCILGTPGVTALLAYSSQQDRSRRRYSVSFTILTATGHSVTGDVPVALGVGA